MRPLLGLQDFACWLWLQWRRLWWFFADCFVHVGFSVGVWICSDLPSAWAAFKWKRARRRVEAMRESERRGR